MKKVQLVVDAIDACLEVLKKEVADLEACREHLLSGDADPSCFEDQTLISSLCLFSFHFLPAQYTSFFSIMLHLL